MCRESGQAHFSQGQGSRSSTYSQSSQMTSGAFAASDYDRRHFPSNRWQCRRGIDPWQEPTSIPLHFSGICLPTSQHIYTKTTNHLCMQEQSEKVALKVRLEMT